MPGNGLTQVASAADVKLAIVHRGRWIVGGSSGSSIVRARPKRAHRAAPVASERRAVDISSAGGALEPLADAARGRRRRAAADALRRQPQRAALRVQALARGQPVWTPNFDELIEGAADLSQRPDLEFLNWARSRKLTVKTPDDVDAATHAPLPPLRLPAPLFVPSALMRARVLDDYDGRGDEGRRSAQKFPGARCAPWWRLLLEVRVGRSVAQARARRVGGGGLEGRRAHGAFKPLKPSGDRVRVAFADEPDPSEGNSRRPADG